MFNHFVSITVDIEDWYHIPSVCGSPFSEYHNTDEFFEKWKYRYDYLSKPTKKILDLLNEFKVAATFFVVGDVVKYYPGLVELIVDNGHEVACHGLHHTCKIDQKVKKPLMSIAEFEKKTLSAKRILEKACRENVIGYRAPNALIGGWMLDSLEKIGFKYDSSVCINSLYNKTDSSLKEISSYPYHPKRNGMEAGGERDFVEFPLAYWDVLSFKIPTHGGPLLRFFGANMILKGLKQSLKRGNTVFYVHAIDISDDKFPSIGKGRPLYWIIKGKIIENRIRFILNNLKNINKLCLRDMLEVL